MVNARIKQLKCTVYSAREVDLESGFKPFVEAEFDDEHQAALYCHEWNALYDWDRYWYMCTA